MTATVSPGPLPVPDNFPFEWPAPDLAARLWTWDQMHYPHPFTPMTASYEWPSFTEGSTRGFQAIKIPAVFHPLTINGYAYQSMEFLQPADSFPPPWWPEVEQEFITLLPNLTPTWDNDYLPQVQAFNTKLREFDYAGASSDALFAFMDEARRTRVHMWDLHMRVVIPVMGAASRFAETCQELLGLSEQEAYVMLQGFDNLSVESGAALWDLSRKAIAQPSVAKLLETTQVEGLPDALRASEPSFWADFERYLERYGWRADVFELADPAWAENPAIPLNTLGDLVHAPDEAGPATTEEQCRREREEAVLDARSRLEGNPGAPIFEMMLGVSQQYLPIQENHNFYIDQMNTVLLRRPILALGDRLVAANAIAHREDVFYFSHAELIDAVQQPKARDYASLVEERRAERERWRGVVPPREIGTMPPGGMTENPLSTAFFGRRVEASKDPKVINGIGASAGTVTAPARIVPSLAEAGKLEPGDVLVCTMTMPAWTPLFASVSAVVADAGGILSHCAIVAREYRIPCVVGTRIGTEVLKDGQRITVDGTQGIVRIEG